MSSPVTFRPFETLEEYQDCVDFQEEIWGIGFREQVSTAILMIANKLGGLAAGAYDEDGRLQGFVFGLTGVRDGEPVHWSDMLAVRPGLRDRGLGTRLKAYQRSVLLERGVRLMYWTFDPLQGRNAYVNFAKLGIVSRKYVPNMYGDTGSSLHRVGTDRLVAHWVLDARRVTERLDGEGSAPTLEELDEAGPLPRIVSWSRAGAFPEPGAPDLSLEGSRLVLPVPEDVNAMMEGDLELAVRWREATRDPFVHYLDRGWELREFLRGAPVSHYLLVRDGEDPEPGESDR